MPVIYIYIYIYIHIITLPSPIIYIYIYNHPSFTHRLSRLIAYGRHSTIRRARHPFQGRWALAVWDPGVYSQSPCLHCPRVEWHLQALRQLSNCPGTARLPFTKSLMGRIYRTRMVPGWRGRDTQGGEFRQSGLLSPNLSHQRRRQDFFELLPGEWHHSSSRTSTSTRQSRRLASQGSLAA